MQRLENVKERVRNNLQERGSMASSCDVALVQLGPDVAAVLSLPRISRTAGKVGLQSGRTYDIANGYDLTKAEVRKRVLGELAHAKPKMVVISPLCDQYSSLCNLAGYRGSAERVRKMLQAKIILRFAMQVAQQQVRDGNRFMFEHPQAARSWQDHHVQRVLRRQEVGTVVFDQCMFGLADVVSGELHRKSTRHEQQRACSAGT